MRSLHRDNNFRLLVSPMAAHFDRNQSAMSEKMFFCATLVYLGVRLATQRNYNGGSL